MLPTATPPHYCGGVTDSKADLLLDALVAYWRDQLTGANLAALIDREVDKGLEAARELTLNQVVTRGQITATAYKYATQWRIAGSIPELVGEIAARLYTHTVHDSEPLRHLIDQRQFEEFAATLVGLPAFRRMVDRLYESPLTTSWASWFVYRVASELLADNRRLAERVPGVAALLEAGGQLLGKVVPEPGRRLDLRVREFSERLVRYIQARGRLVSQNVEGTAAQEPLVDAALDLWAEHADDPVSSLGELVSPDDVEDFLVLVFEFWFTFRETDYFRQMLSEGVGYFFEKYGDATLAELLADIGVGRADMVEEATRFAPPILEVVLGNGMLENWIRRTHADFFASEAVRRILG